MGIKCSIKKYQFFIFFFTVNYFAVNRAGETLPCLYRKHSEGMTETCEETTFVNRRRSLLQCASNCALHDECFSFYYSSKSQTCLGCPLKYTILNTTENYTHYTPIKGKDGNMCRYFEYNNHYYNFNTDLKNREEASDKCSQFDGHLVYVETESEHLFLENVSAIIPGITNEKFWIGAFLDDNIGDGKWRWGSGVKTEETFEDFKKSQPSGNGNCVVMGYGKGMWDDQPCSNLNKFICEIE